MPSVPKYARFWLLGLVVLSVFGIPLNGDDILTWQYSICNIQQNIDAKAEKK